MTTIEKNGTNYESELNNVDQSKWPSIKMSSTLEALNSVDSAYSKESFYKTNGEKVEYDMDSVKAYLKKLADTANYGEFVKEVNKGNWGLMNLAVQIALETLGYDVGKIDGLMGPKTRGKVIEFQRANGLSPDGVVGPKTAQKLLELLGGEPATVEKTDKEKIEKVEKNDKEVKKGEEVKAEDLVKNLPEGGTVEFKDGKGVDTSKEGEVEVTVVVKVGAEVREIVVKVTVVVEVVVEETDKEKIDKVEANDKDVKKGDEVKAEDLVKNLPEGGTVEFKDGQGVDTSKEGTVEVTVIVKVGAEVREIVVKVTVVVEVVVEETDQGKIAKVEANDQEVKKGGEIKAEDLVKNLPEGGTVEFKDGKGVDTSKEGTVEVTVVVKVGAEVREIVVKVTVVVNQGGQEEHPENPGDSDEKERILTYGEAKSEYIPKDNGETFTITNRDDLKKFSTELYNKYDDAYFAKHDLALLCCYDQSTHLRGYTFGNVSRSGNNVNVDYKEDYNTDLTSQTVCEVLFVEINKGDNVTWNDTSTKVTIDV